MTGMRTNLGTGCLLALWRLYLPTPQYTVVAQGYTDFSEVEKPLLKFWAPEWCYEAGGLTEDPDIFGRNRTQFSRPEFAHLYSSRNFTEIMTLNFRKPLWIRKTN